MHVVRVAAVVRWIAHTDAKRRAAIDGEGLDLGCRAIAVYGPVRADGYPALIWDPMTGLIDHSVAAYWRDHYDLRYILQGDWATLGPKLRGKLHILVGTMDTWHLNNAVYLMEDFLKSTMNPPADAVVECGERQPHCWSGHDTAYWFKSFESRILQTAPAGSDVSSWRY